MRYLDADATIASSFAENWAYEALAVSASSENSSHKLGQGFYCSINPSLQHGLASKEG